MTFRYDDFAAGSPSLIERKIFEAFRGNKVSFTCSVIPFVCAGEAEDPAPQSVSPLSEENSAFLRSAIRDGVVEVALHGYSHQAIQPQGGYTEFSGVDANSQFEKINNGKKFLEEKVGTSVLTFVPPWDSYDLNTIKVLDVLHFRTLSANLKGPVTDPARLVFLPDTCELSDLRQAVALARKSVAGQAVIVPLFHKYDFIEDDPKRGKWTLPEFLGLLSWLKSQDDIRIVPIGQAADLVDDLSLRRYLDNQRLLALSGLLPPALRPEITKVYLRHPSGWAGWVLFRIVLFILALVIVGLSVAVAAGTLILRKSRFLMQWGQYGSAGACALLSVYAFRHLQVSYKGIMAVSFMLGVTVGAWLFARLRLRKANP